MNARRSKRLCSTHAKVSASEDADVPALKRRRAALEPETSTKSVKSTTIQKNGSTVDSLTKVDSNESGLGKNSRRSTRNVKSTKSSYFESPVASEGSSSEDDQSSRSIETNRKSNTRATKASSKIVEESEEYDSEDEVPKRTRKRKPNTSVKNLTAKKKASSAKLKVDDSSEDEFAGPKLLSNQNQRQAQIKGFESESDSSSEEDLKPARELEPNKSSFTADPLESDGETTVDVKPTEFFDFSALVSQMSQASNEEENKEKPCIKQAVVEKPKPVPTTSTKKKSRGKKPAVAEKDVAVKTEKLEVCELLAMGEKTDMSAKDIKESVSKAQNEYEIPKQVEIVFDTPLLKKKKKCDDLEMALRRRLNNIRRENQVYIHKAHVLCWIAHGIHINRLLNSADLLACALSVIPNEHFYPAGRMKMEYLEKLIKYFTTKVKLMKDPVKEEQKDLLVSLQNQFEKKEANSKRDLCFMFICIIRAMGIKCRLVMNLNVAPLKPNSDQLLPMVQKKEDEQSSMASTSAKAIEFEKKVKQVAETSQIKNEVEKSEKTRKSASKEKQSIPEREEKKPKSVGKKESADKEEKIRPSSRAARSTSEVDSKKPGNDDENNSKKKSKANVNDKNEMKKESGADDKNIRRSSRISTSKSKYFTEEASDDEEEEKPKPKSSQRSVMKHETSDDEEERKPKPKSSQRSVKKPVAAKTRKSVTNNSLVEEMSSSDSEDSANEFRAPKKRNSRKVLSTDEEKEAANEKSEVKSDKKPAKKTNHWLEVFLEEEEKWSSVDIGSKKFLCDEELSKNASAPIRYVLAFNSDQTIKDVTRRYAHQFLSVTRKLRADEEWWISTMAPFKPRSTPREREEDEELEKKLEEQPIPKTISELKNHPLYALQRHLLKFQAIYPQDAIPVDYIKTKDGTEPVYRRACVHQLHGREMWIKEAKVVKLNEKPYKIVKGRQKKDKFGGPGEGPRDLELFGLWQTEDYDPPVAENGKVPRNAFGNVELFKMSMLPKGTVYLQIPGLQRIANKLNIDCAAAITGFEYSTNGWSYPVKEGFVVCEEFKDVLLDAYNQEVEEAEKKEKQKREERIYANWKRLIRAMFIAEKLKRKYNFGEPSSSKKTEASANRKSETKSKK